MADIEVKRVFVSYSWAVKERVRELVDRLIRDGIEVIVDFYNLNKGDDKYRFMERSVNDESIDRVLVICDKTYADKADKRSGGVGDETVIITPEIYNKKDSNKFIPVIFDKDSEGNPCCPAYIKSRIYVDLSNESEQESNYEELLREIYNKPSFRRPALGKMPEYLNDEKHDFSKLRESIRIAKTSKDCRLDPLFIDNAVLTMEKYVDKKIQNCEELIETIDDTKDLRDLIIDYCSILLSKDTSINGLVIDLIEKINNDVGFKCDDEYRREVAGYFTWELLICITALLVHYKKYEELHSILTHTFFLRRQIYPEFEPCDYSKLCFYSQKLEEYRKSKNQFDRLFTLQGEMLTLREHEPIITKANIINSDLLLYHLYPMYYGNNSYWFPVTYTYYKGQMEFWTKLQSGQYCMDIMKLIEADTIDELKNKISTCPYPNKMRYSNYHFEAPWITKYIDVNEIGKFR